MIEIYPNVFVGNDEDYLNLEKEHIPGRDIDQPTGDWCILHAAKEPHHRAFVQYAGRVSQRLTRISLCPPWQQDGTEYGGRKSPEFFSKEMITAGLDF